MIELSRYTKDKKLKWDNFISNSKNGVFLFYRDYLEYHEDRFIDHSLVICKRDKIVAIFPANEDRQEIVSHGGLTFGSLIMSKNLRAVEVIQIFKLIIAYYSNLGFSRIIYKPIPSIFQKYPSDEDLYALFLNDAKLFRRDISSVLKIDNRLRFSETKRQSVAKCKKEGIEVIENNCFIEYWGLLSEVLLKYNAKPVHSLEEIVRLKKIFPDKIKLYEARKEGELLAGIVIYDYENVAHTQYMANSQKGRKIGALDFINDELITNQFQEKEYFSFGASTESQGKKLKTGLIQQKEMMGGRGITLDFYSISLQKNIVKTL